MNMTDRMSTTFGTMLLTCACVAGSDKAVVCVAGWAGHDLTGSRQSIAGAILTVGRACWEKTYKLYWEQLNNIDLYKM